ncbi:MAG: response regulator [Planctomycetota bacterium]|nr:response regulator [Planctomycetota bacterium]
MTPTKNPFRFSTIEDFMGPIDILLVASSGTSTDELHEALASSKWIRLLRRVPDGAEAMAYLRGEGEYASAQRPGLVLLDIDLDTDVKHGFEILYEIKEDPELRPLPVVVLTNSSLEADVLQTYAAGACSFISKPVGLLALKELAEVFAEYWAMVSELPNHGRLLRHEQQGTESASVGGFSNSEKRAAPINILLVDDNEDDAVLLEVVFRDSPVLNLLHTAKDGFEAMAYLQREGKFENARRPGLILLDINMPRKHGFEVLCEVKEDPKLRDIPVVMMTSSKRESDILQAYSGGACSFIAKPVDFERMRRVADHFANYWTQVVDVPQPV